MTAAIGGVGPVVQCAPGVARNNTFTDFMAADQEFYDRFVVQMLRRGVFALPGGRWYISTAHTDEDIAQTVAVIDEALGATLAEGPGPVTATTE
ncbi:hypothetical protein [Sanguibacter sp. Z1732]|uniref:hypothetical protein n=1 Tax=Sanguibacter sp. Z1732 TaxID=3435412 RepID=UPI003D9C7D2F